MISDIKRALTYFGFSLILGIGSARGLSYSDFMFYGALVLAVMGIYQISSISDPLADEEE